MFWNLNVLKMDFMITDSIDSTRWFRVTYNTNDEDMRCNCKSLQKYAELFLCTYYLERDKIPPTENPIDDVMMMARIYECKNVYIVLVSLVNNFECYFD